MQKRGVYFLLLVLGLVAISGLLNYIGLSNYANKKKDPKAKPVLGLEIAPKLGLDVDGGFRFTIRADRSKLSPEDLKLWDQKAAQVVNILEKRAQKALGVVEATVYRKGDERFIVELPGFKDEQEARQVISTSARLDYYWAKSTVTALRANRRYEEVTRQNEQGEPEIWFKRRGQPDDKAFGPGSPEWKEMLATWEPVVSGEHLANAMPIQSRSGQGYDIELHFDAEGARQLNEFAKKVYNKKENLAAVLDDRVITFAFVQDGATFPEGIAVLQAAFPAPEAERIVGLLRAGALPVDLVEESVLRVDPVIGTQALGQIITAGLLAFGIIVLFLLVYYAFPGFVALLALVIYTLICFAVFQFLGVTFSLAAIAGFILSIGMAVDANILIFERLKEEMRGGKGLMTAIDLGFKRAFPAILDSNTCTILTSLVLMNIGTGPVKGFATTLMIGVLLSLFTAVTVTRSLLVFMLDSGIGKDPKLYAMNRGWFGEGLEQRANEKPLRIIERMGLYFIISGVVILPGLIFMGLGGIKPNVEFLYGVESQVVLPPGSTTKPAELNAKLESAGLHGANVKIGVQDQASGGQVTAFVTIPLDANPELKKLVVDGTNEEKMRGRQMIVRALGGDDTIVQSAGGEESSVSNEKTGIKGEVSFESTSPTVREETIRGAVIGVVVSSALIVLYLAMRFGLALGGFVVGLRFGFSAIIAMLHDVVVVLGLAAITGYFLNWEISQLTITAMLTVIGFSVHDTIVIFDRIRENLRRPLPGENFEHLVNRSITQSFARSLNTSGTVIVTLAILVFIGSATPDLRHFNAAMLVGILSGTYSSIFNAAPILVVWERIVQKRKGAGATVMAHQANVAAHEREASDRESRGDEPPQSGYAQTKRKK